MIGDHIHQVGIGGELFALSNGQTCDVNGVFFFVFARGTLVRCHKGVLSGRGGHSIEEVFHRPVVGHIKGMFGEVGIAGLGKHK